MMSPFLWIVSILMTQCYCKVDEFFRTKMDQILGYKQCQCKCSERRGCTDIDYSSNSLSCTLIFNLTDIRYFQDRPFCGTHYCTEVMVQTRSKKIHILQVFDDTLKPTVSSPAMYEKPLVFKPIIGADKCKRTGRRGGVFEPYSHFNCRLRSVQTLKNNRRYSWVFTFTHMKVIGKYGKNMHFSFQKNGREYGAFSFKKGEYHTYRHKSVIRQKVTNSPSARLRLILHKNLLRVTHLKDHIELNPVRLKGILTDFYAEITLFQKNSCKLLISKGKDEH